jgi:hypothetical protein
MAPSGRPRERTQPSRPPWLYPAACAGLVGASALVVFGATLAPTVTAEDSGELIAAAWHFGVPHPPGYPLWTLLCGGFLRIVPAGAIAFRANLFSAVCTAAAGMVAFAALRELGIARCIAGGAALTWVFSRWSWSQAVITEVYGLNSLLTATLLWCALRWNRTRGRRPLLGASFVLGLGMGNHHTIALAGLALIVWILLLQPNLLRRWRLILASVGLFVVGLLPYLYLPLAAAADPPFNWGDPSTPERFWQHATRHQYGAIGPTKVVEPRSFARFVPQMGYVARSVIDDLTPGLFAAAILGLSVLAHRRKRLLLLVALWVTATAVLFTALSNFDLDRTSRWAMRVFLIPVSLGLTIPLAFLLTAIAERLRGDPSSPPGWRRLFVFVLASAGPVLLVVSHRRHCDYANYRWASDHGRNLLACMLPNALVFPSGDHSTFPLVYLTLVEGQRPDVLIADLYGYLDPGLYADQPADSPDPPDAWLIKHARRPVYYAVKQTPPVAGAHFVTAGLLYHLLPDGKPFDADGLLATCTYRNETEPARIDLGAVHIIVDATFFRGLARLEAGDVEGAELYFSQAAEAGAGIKEVFNNLGSAWAEHGYPNRARPHFESAADLDPRYATPRWNLFRIARAHRDWTAAEQRLRELAAADPDDPRPLNELGRLILAAREDPASAAEFWRASLRRRPDQPAIRRALADLERP